MFSAYRLGIQRASAAEKRTLGYFMTGDKAGCAEVFAELYAQTKTAPTHSEMQKYALMKRLFPEMIDSISSMDLPQLFFGGCLEYCITSFDSIERRTICLDVPSLTCRYKCCRRVGNKSGRDEKTLLPEATKNSQFEATFYWCDSNGRKVPDHLCSHVAVVVGGDTTIEACEREQNELVKLILELMECTPEELAISPGNCDH